MYFKVRELARAMRKKPTPAEAFFWAKTRNRKLFDLKFNRQYIIQSPLDAAFTKYYIADFHCYALKLIIELDGNVHIEQNEIDLVRTDHMHQWGFTVLRFTNEQVLMDWDFVAEQIHGILLFKGAG